MDVYQANRVNRAMIVLEEAMKGVYACYGASSHKEAPSLRTVRDKIADMGKQTYKMQVNAKKEML